MASTISNVLMERNASKKMQCVTISLTVLTNRMNRTVEVRTFIVNEIGFYILKHALAFFYPHEIQSIGNTQHITMLTI